MIPTMPSFPEFYREVYRREPFPWQVRLAESVAKTEGWPSEIGVPTGLGKTACLDIAIWWLASQANRAPSERSAPTRIWWVVNRRLLVDSTAMYAEELASLLSDTGATDAKILIKPAISAVAQRLRGISADSSATPLEVIALRGGISSRTPSDPARPAVILCTLPMYGSRLLFRGYGSSLRSVDAAMAGTDSLVLLDEAHLAPHLKSLIEALDACMPGTRPLLNSHRSRAALVALTATGESDESHRFDLDEMDYKNEKVVKRLDAGKPLEVRIANSGDVAKALCDAALELLNGAGVPTSILVFANTPKTAREVHNRLLKISNNGQIGANVLLLTGLIREREARTVREKILDSISGMPATRIAGERECHLVVVATQTLEVGADLDAEYLVTEACGVRALTQRLGRLNRMGRYSQSKAIYVHSSLKGPANAGDRASWPVYGEEPATVLERLQQAPKNSEGMVDLCPRLVADTLGRPEDDPGRSPELLPGILWEWIKTTTPPEGEAPVEPYFSGIASPIRTVAIFWRSHLPDSGERIWPRPTNSEAVDVPLTVFRKVIADESVFRLASDSVTLEKLRSSRELKPGDRVVLPTVRGLLDHFGWNPDATETVVDVSLTMHGLPLNAEAVKRICGRDFVEEIRKIVGNDDVKSEEVNENEQESAIAKLLNTIRYAVETPKGWEKDEWERFTTSLEPKLVVAKNEVPRLPVRCPAAELPVAEFDETSLVDKVSLSKLATLDGHGNAVGARARSVARSIGISELLVETIELAGDLHDIGKADERFQRWLDPDQVSSVAMAKSGTPRHQWASTRVAAGWPRGGRHEALSARLAENWLTSNPDWGECDERDLLLHLIISHHGKGRPLVLPVKDGSPKSVRTKVRECEIEVPADLSQVDWMQPARFRRLNGRFGPWGLALLEAIIVRSDHAVSAK